MARYTIQRRDRGLMGRLACQAYAAYGRDIEDIRASCELRISRARTGHLMISIKEEPEMLESGLVADPTVRRGVRRGQVIWQCGHS